MIGEKIVEAKQCQGKPVDALCYIVTDKDSYELHTSGFKEAPVPGHAVGLLPNELRDRQIIEIRSDCECLVIVLDNESKIVFDWTYNPFEERSWPTLDFQSEAESREWVDEFRQMRVIGHLAPPSASP